MAGCYEHTSKAISTLAIYGRNDVPIFKELGTKYHKGFSKYFDEYFHDGKHSYPVINKYLKTQILSLLQEATRGNKKEAALNDKDTGEC